MGTAVGVELGKPVGIDVGSGLGIIVGSTVGLDVGAELGALVGSSYTSYSGFYRLDGAGASQMALTAQVLLSTEDVAELSKAHQETMTDGTWDVPIYRR